MLKNCIDLFLQQDAYKYIFDRYVPADGDYRILELRDGVFSLKDHWVVKMAKKTRELNLTYEERKRIAYLDYYSRLVEMNKPVDPKKIIQSNNYLAFWIKKESLGNGKLTMEGIDRYYDILSDPGKKCRNKKDLEIYEASRKKLGEINIEALRQVQEWVKDNIWNLPDMTEGKDYLKLFFKIPGTDIKTEGERYFLRNLFNKNDYNQKIGDTIYGVPSQNMQLNPKKPFLENKDREPSVPVLESMEEVQKKKLFFDYLLQCASGGKYNIFIYSEYAWEGRFKFLECNDKDLPETKNAYGFFLRIRKDKNEAAIVKMKQLTRYRTVLDSPIQIYRIADVPDEDKRVNIYKEIRDLSVLREMISEIYFSKYLLHNFYTPAKDITGITGERKQLMVSARDAAADWLIFGEEERIRGMWNRLSQRIVIATMKEGYLLLAKHQFNVWMSIKDYFERSRKTMADVMLGLRKSLFEKITQDEYASIESDEEYYYAVGQVMSILIARSRSKKSDFSFFIPLLNIQKPEFLKEKIRHFLKKYGYDIASGRFECLASMVMAYEPEKKVLTDYMLAGFLAKGVIYEKEEKQG